MSIALSGREPTPSRPFGWGQERFLWTFVAAVGMFVAGATFAIGWGVYELLKPPTETEYLVPYVVLGLAFIAEGTSWLRALRQTRGEAGKARMPLLRYVRESRDPNVKMVLSEDSAALIGLAIALAGITADAVSGAHVWDPVASILIGVLLISVAIWMGRDAKNLLIGAAARPDERRALEEALTSYDEVVELQELLTLTLGPKALLVAARLDLADHLRGDQIEQLSDEIDERLRQVVPDVTEVFLDATPGGGRGLG